MKNIDELVVTPEFRARVNALGVRSADSKLRVVAGPRWQPLVNQLDVAALDTNTDNTANSDGSAVLVVGPLAAVLRHAAEEADEFAFVMPVAQITKWWQRAPSWRDDATLDLWRAGWSPLEIHRLLIATNDTTVEFVIGSARRTPNVAVV